MDHSLTASPATEIVRLPDFLDLPAAASLAEHFIRLRGQNVAIDATGVQRLGGQCLQVLLSAHLTWKNDSVRLELVGCSPSFADDLKLLGFEPAHFTEGTNQP